MGFFDPARVKIVEKLPPTFDALAKLAIS